MASTCALRAAGSPRAAALASVRHQRGSSRVVSPAAKGVSREGSRRRAASWRVEAAGAGTREAGVSAAEGLRRMTLQLAADGADGAARLKALVRRGKGLPALAAEAKTLDNRIVGCTTQVWLTARLDAAGHVIFQGDSDSDISRGMMAVMFESLQDLTPEQILEVTPEMLEGLGLGGDVVTPSRASGVYNLLEGMRKRARQLTPGGAACGEVFPSLTITADAITPQGAFAEAQATYLQPDPKMVQALVKVLTEKKVGIVAHFYMDPEVQGVLAAAAKQWPHIHISDSLVMADKAVAMAQAGCTAVAVLGVDFMTENVRAVMDGAGFEGVGVFRLADGKIGCSLAEAAESDVYTAYLSEAAARQGPNLHVIYINTSLRTKAYADKLVPTITCTSSNVVATVLQAAAQVPDLHVWYGPDTYMGGNLAELFRRLVQLGDEEIAKMHPAHDVASVKSLLPRLHYFQEGTCIVHHLFGGEVCDAVRAGYSDAYQTAHFEVPGEMFQLAMEARERGMGTVGSTKNILDFISDRVTEALARDYATNLRFVLGTEAGMITSIVNTAQELLRNGKASGGNPGVSVEVVFPVSLDSMASAQTLGSDSEVMQQLQMVPGPASGEGCSTSGGCASCPYMKMNTLTSLLRVCELVGTADGETTLRSYEPEKYSDDLDGQTVAERGVVSITHMRHFSKTGKLSDELVADITSRNPAS